MKKVSAFIILICAANISCVSSGKTNSFAITKTRNIEGHYVNDWGETAAFIDLIITKDGNEYKYEMTTPYRTLEGKISFSDDPECFYLEGIKWSSWEIDGVSQELPDRVSVSIKNGNELVIRNYENAASKYRKFYDIGDEYVHLIRKYVTLPNGALVDARIHKELVEMMFTRFEAIENGDIDAFRSTLGELEDGVSYHYQLQLLFDFFGDFFNIDPDTFEEAITSGSEELHAEIAPALFNGEHPAIKRNAGLKIKILDVLPAGGLKVTAINSKNEEFDYYFAYY
ncbi:MAG: hypothetical protein LBU82_05200 [Treponema sp.]|jgi:hypothetical protein|nr:hypothetical protein [Treponema sp.]